MVKEEVLSPCVLICDYGPDGYCKGCFRDPDEITDWVYMTNEEKLEVLRMVEERKKSL